MALANKTFTTGLRIVGVKPGVLFSKANSSLVNKLSVAYITGRSSRVEEVKKPAPWPYKERGYSNLHAFIDKTEKRLDDNSKVIVVEGMPAIGKSNLARALAEELEMKYFPMVTSDSYFITQYGQDIRQINHLLSPHLRTFDENDFFKNPKHERAIWLQFILFVHKFWQYMDALAHVLNTGQGVVLDRCVYSESVFTDAFLDAGYISKAGKAAIERMKKRVMEELMRPHLIVYLDAPVSVVLDNLKKRGRGEEKAFTKEVLEKIENNYKFGYLKEITNHAELVAYDWSVPGDAEVIVEDIERIDFDKYDVHDSKMEDWRLKEEWDWCEKRYEFTNNQLDYLGKITVTPVTGVPGLMLMADDQDEYEQAWESIPGNKYEYGFNPDVGDDVLFKTRNPMRNWRDFDLEPRTKSA